ncbi:MULTISPECIES: shikimate kinase [Providencia]|uniref:Adenylate kinase n=1 Tax=Providencia stuartii TaxID=588 RepID=A0ABD5L6B7_PROST|nr:MULTISPECIES: shikimate kinase [Providencia]ELR5044707.1 adenylate kinase [Providencia rettgeri]MCR4180229.1 adenylate kinase [Providencia vermicola]ELR5119973.1 adenylate kinase [Providencia stuartii]ELR5291083.1 adenylate kinase [Providencia stuartii]URE76956.1 adenylate kinase [Providencia stuartii]
MKINIIGCSGSGKSTLGHTLSSLYSIPYIELDALYWQKNWQHSSDEQLKEKLTQAFLAAPNGWVLDGNYTRTQPIKWQEVDLVIWLDYSFSRTLYQSIRRALYRIISQKELWPNTGNNETWKKTFFSRDSILLWVLKTYHKGKAPRIASMINKQYQHISFIRLTTPKETAFFLKRIQEDINNP